MVINDDFLCEFWMINDEMEIQWWMLNNCGWSSMLIMRRNPGWYWTDLAIERCTSCAVASQRGHSQRRHSSQSDRRSSKGPLMVAEFYSIQWIQWFLSNGSIININSSPKNTLGVSADYLVFVCLFVCLFVCCGFYFYCCGMVTFCRGFLLRSFNLDRPVERCGWNGVRVERVRYLDTLLLMDPQLSHGALRLFLGLPVLPASISLETWIDCGDKLWRKALGTCFLIGLDCLL